MLVQYTSEERNSVKDYIAKQFSTQGAVIETVSTIPEDGVSVLRITTDEHIVYATLGAGSYKFENKLRKDMMHFEAVMLASKSITSEQERFIIENLPKLIIQCNQDKEMLGELHRVDWVKNTQFAYPTFMLLQAAKPLELKKKIVQFFVALPLFKCESDWIDETQRRVGLLHPNYADLTRECAGYFLACYESMRYGPEMFYVDYVREKACLTMGDDLIIPYSDPGVRDNIRWGITMKRARIMGSLPFAKHRIAEPETAKPKPINRLWKYEEQEDGVIITRYIGLDEEVVVPEEISGKPVVRIGEGAFSPDRCKGHRYTRANEALMLLRKVTLPKTITTIECEMFKGCCNLEDVDIPKSIKEIGHFVFTNCSMLKTTEYGNAYYFGIKGNPYYLLLKYQDGAESVAIHPDTKLIVGSALNQTREYQEDIGIYMVPKFVDIPQEVKKFEYSGWIQQTPVFRVKKGSSPARFLVKKGFAVEYI